MYDGYSAFFGANIGDVKRLGVGIAILDSGEC
jgi:hypothetical protein